MHLFKTYDVRTWTISSVLGQGAAQRPCEHGKELTCSINGANFLTNWAATSFSRWPMSYYSGSYLVGLLVHWFVTIKTVLNCMFINVSMRPRYLSSQLKYDFRNDIPLSV